MFIIRPNSSFYKNFHSYPFGADAATFIKNDSCQASCHGLSSQKVPPASFEETKHEPALLMNSNTIVEKTPLHRNETSEKTTISLDVAGFGPEHLKVAIEDHVLLVTGQRTNKLGDSFVTRRRFALKADTYDEDTVQAELEDGILQITIQKKNIPKSRHIPITVTRPTPSFPSQSASSSPAAEATDSHDDPSDDQASIKASPMTSEDEVISVETVNEKDEDAEEEVVDSPNNNDNAVLAENTADDSSTQKSREDTWEKVVHA